MVLFYSSSYLFFFGIRDMLRSCVKKKRTFLLHRHTSSAVKHLWNGKSYFLQCGFSKQTIDCRRRRDKAQKIFIIEAANPPDHSTTPSHPAPIIMLTSLHITPAFINKYLPLSLQKTEKYRKYFIVNTFKPIFYCLIPFF